MKEEEEEDNKKWGRERKLGKCDDRERRWRKGSQDNGRRLKGK